MTVQPWYRQFWPWFIIALPGSAVVASLITVWIAVAAAPERVDGAGLLAVPAELTANRKILVFDLGLPPIDGSWPDEIRVTIDPRGAGDTQYLKAQRIDSRQYEAAIAPLQAGAHEVTLEAANSELVLQGNWAYPAPVWKLRADE